MESHRSTNSGQAWNFNSTRGNGWYIKGVRSLLEINVSKIHLKIMFVDRETIQLDVILEKTTEK